MPVVALVGAAASISAGVAVGATTLMGGLMVAGGALTAIGTITGNKKVAALGALMGLGAGVANAVSGAGSAAGGAGEFSAASADPMANLEPTSGGATGGLETAVEPAGAYSVPVERTTGLVGTELDLVDATGGPETASDFKLTTSATADKGLDLGRSTPEQLNQTVKDSIKPADPTPTNTEMPKFDDNREPGGNSAGTGDDSRLLTKDSVTGKAKSRMDEAMDFIRDPKNKELVRGGLGLVAAGMKGYSDQALLKQKAALEEEIKQRDRNRLNSSISGMARFA